VSEQNRLLRSQRVSPEDDFAYGQGISPEATWRNLIPFAEFGLGMAPVSGEAMAARDAWDASGRGGNALLQGNYGDAASEYLNMGTGLLGAIPGAGIVARGTKRGAAWMDRNLPTGFNRLLDSVYPSDPANTTMIFAGPTAKTADQQALSQAQEMATQGASRDDIWRDTGWMQGVDGKWKFEIDDSKSYYDTDAYPELKEAAEFDGRPYDPSFDNAQVDFAVGHDDLYRAYSDVGEAPLMFFPRGAFGENVMGGVTHSRGSMALANDMNANDGRSYALHELQHLVQGREGFARGSDPKSATIAGYAPDPEVVEQAEFLLKAAKEFGSIDEALKYVPPIAGKEWHTAAIAIAKNDPDRIPRLRLDLTMKENPELAYRHHAGETEARNVQSRMNMNAAERRATPPWETQDVPDDQQIVRFR
jgi:hypothetical protein